MPTHEKKLTSSKLKSKGAKSDEQLKGGTYTYKQMMKDLGKAPDQLYIHEVVRILVLQKPAK